MRINSILTALLACFPLLSAFSQTADFEWVNTCGGPAWEEGMAIAADPAGNVYTAGRFSETVDFDPGPGTFDLTATDDYDAFLTKVDATGNFRWAKQFGGEWLDQAHAIEFDAAGNIYLTVIIGDNPFSGPNAWFPNVIKLDPSGNVLWSKQIEYAWIHGMAVAPAGDVYVTGWFEGTVDFDPDTSAALLTATGENDIFIAKLDAAGNLLWARQQGGALHDQGYSVALDPAGKVFVLSNFRGPADFDPGPGTATLIPAGNDDVALTRLDANGNFLALHHWGGTGWDNGVSLAADAAGHIYMGGTFGDTVDFDPGPGTYTLGGPNGAHYVCKLDTGGSFLWVTKTEGLTTEWIHSRAVDATGNLYTTGTFSAPIDFDPGPATVQLVPAGAGDMFVRKIDAAGNHLWTKQMGGGSAYAYPFAIAVDAQSVYTTGYFEGAVDFDPGAGTHIRTATAGKDVFTHTMGQTAVGIAGPLSNPTIRIYPNPTEGRFVLDLGMAYTEATVTIRDLGGRLLFAQAYTDAQTIPLVLDAPAGVYVLTVSNENLHTTVRLLQDW